MPSSSKDVRSRISADVSRASARPFPCSAISYRRTSTVRSTEPMEATRCRQPAPLGLEHLLSPIGVPEFLSENWDRSPLAIARSSPSHYEGLLTRTELDRLVSASVVDERDARIVKDGVADPSLALFDDAGRANIAGLYGAYDQGYTVVINNVHKRRAEVGILCRNIEESLGHPAGANAYLTPAGARGL